MLHNFARHVQFPIILERDCIKKKTAQVNDSMYYYIIIITIIDWFIQL